MNYPKKLIEVALPLPEINDASSYDKMPGIGPHPKGIHHWWARLPLPTARAVLFASVVDDPEAHPDKWPTEQAQAEERERLFGILRRMMVKKLHEHPEVYAEARTEMLKHCGGVLPPVLDPFAGGGSIPLEANRLGFDAHAGDLNPVAVLLNRCNLELAPRWSGHAPVNPVHRKDIGSSEHWRDASGLAADVRYYSSVILERAQPKIGRLYPQVSLPKAQGGGQATVVAWIWTPTVVSPNPAAHGKHVPLASTFMLSTKAGKLAWIEPVIDDSAPNGWRVQVRTSQNETPESKKARSGTKAGKAQDFICLVTSTPIPRSYAQREGKAGHLSRRLTAVVVQHGRGRLYLDPTPELEAIADLEDARVAEARSSFLAAPLPTRAEITGGVCTAYGLSTLGHLFSSRQLLTLLTLSDLVREVANTVRDDASLAGLSPDDSDAYARTVTTFLALAVDRCADFNNVLCRWSASNEKVMNLFGRQAMPMVFDSAEANTLGESVGAWSTCSEYVADCIEVMPAGPSERSSARQADAATDTAWPSQLLVSTDPPYYQNISYATLSDYFYVWLRRCIGGLHPDLFRTILVPKMPELIASPDRFGGSKQLAKEHFETGFRAAFTALQHRMDLRFPLTVYYAFKQDDEDGNASDEQTGGTGIDLTTGWETLLEALISSGFQITATWPVRASQKWRMVSMGTNALASYIVLACRPREPGAPQTDRRTFVAELRRDLPAALRHLQQGNIAPVDFAQAAIGPGMAIYSRFKGVLESTSKPMSVRSALGLINQTLTEVLSEQEGEFDAETRWAVQWFEQYGTEEGPYGEAEILSKAKNVTVGSLEEARILRQGRGKVRLLRRDELSDSWESSAGSGVTVWEITHRLISRLETGGAAAAAEIARDVDTRGDVARDLAYRLYSMCERKHWAAEQRAYNSLVIDWAEIQRLARGKPEHPGTLF